MAVRAAMIHFKCRAAYLQVIFYKLMLVLYETSLINLLGAAYMYTHKGGDLWSNREVMSLPCASVHEGLHGSSSSVPLICLINGCMFI